ncbi:MAG: glycosyltransferase family 2 protein [Clostridia bacterium]|nr:glycosyltransferase family 2 protein [Clostridia bacterium]
MRFSIIMPVYNIENYLETAVSSVLTQTFDDFELILVEDASPDNCAAICDKLANADKRVKVIHNKINSGAGLSRNFGIQAAQGEFILFVDSDDTISPNTLEILNREADGFDITVFGLNRLFENDKEEIYKTEKLFHTECTTASLKDSGQLLISLNRAGIFPFVWNKVYKRTLLVENNALFENAKITEDCYFNLLLFQKTDKIKVINDCLYNYRKPVSQTLTNSYSPEFLELSKRKFVLEKELLENTGCNNEENLQFIYYVFIKHLLSYFVRNRAKSAMLSSQKQKNLIRASLNDPLVYDIISNYKPNGLAMKLIDYILKHQKINLCYLTAYLISILKN